MIHPDSIKLVIITFTDRLSPTEVGMGNLEHLKMFVETANTGSFSACAKRLGKVQSAVSQGIANLEIDLDIQLFDRSTRKPSLTEEGQRLLEYAKAVLLQHAELQHAAQAINDHHETHVTLALDSALVLPSLMACLKEFSQIFATTSLSLKTGNSSQVLNWVHKEGADLGLMFADTSFKREVNLGFIGNLPFYGMCHPDHPLAKLSDISEVELMLHKQIICKDWGEDAINQFVTLGPDNWWCNHWQDVKSMIANNLGWGYLPKHLASNELEREELMILKFSFDFKPWNPHVDRITPKNKIMGPATTWLAERVTKILDDV